MWICLNDAFFSIVNKDCVPGALLVRARRRGDIEKVWPRALVSYSTEGDYFARAVIDKRMIYRAIEEEIDRVLYPNFKDSVKDEQLHRAYMNVWTAMARVQSSPPYGGASLFTGGIPQPRRTRGKLKKGR